ncbi:hypothetical protein [Bizionia arctica]|uniref:Rieske domain-containing protein n=1 Tax=Bizionia arctica TaxID=1495645 RepID=A0A917LL32_9FLAO|nr:hypothetical protein [Bizionia arctica]GGG39185.1 hypothetical protein GCM10010976_08670 [Bizionia arctica]
MNRIYYIILIAFMVVSCNKSDDNDNENCKFLLDVQVNRTVSLNLNPNLEIPGNSLYIPNIGNAGVIVINSGFEFLAWDAADPNHVQNGCRLVSDSGFEATCNCEDKNKYSLITGQPLGNSALQCGLRNYRVERIENTLVISN